MVLYTVWHKILTGENINEFDKFLSIRQHFPYQNFTLTIFCCLHARPPFRAERYLLAMVYVPVPMQFTCSGIAIRITAHSKQQSCAIYS